MIKSVVLILGLGLFFDVLPFNLSSRSFVNAQEFKNKLNNAQLLQALRSGGHVIYFRHVQTEVDYADQVFARMGH